MQRRIDEKGRLEIPKTFLDNLGTKTNDYVDLILVNDVISLRKVPDNNLKKPQQVQGRLGKGVGKSATSTNSKLCLIIGAAGAVKVA